MANSIIPIGDIFSKRQKKLRGNVPDVYAYDELPRPLRQQIVYILEDVFDACIDRVVGWHTIEGHYKNIVKVIREEHGVQQIAQQTFGGISSPYQAELENFILTHEDIEETMDSVEISLRWIRFLCISIYKHVDFEKVKDKLNFRFNEHGVGYQFTDRHIIRIDSELLHSEAIKPALHLLRQPHYKGAQEEFLKAHRHYRKGEAKDALDECLKAFESVMKAICAKRGWKHDSNATARPLIAACFDNGLVLPFWESHYTSLRSLLECSVPTGRNKLSGHGQGPIPTTVPDHIVAYMLHMTASAIVFLAEAEKNLP